MGIKHTASQNPPMGCQLSAAQMDKKQYFANPSKELSKPLMLTLLNGQPCKPSRLPVGIGFVALGALFVGFVTFSLCVYFTENGGAGSDWGRQVKDKPAAIAMHIQAVLATLSHTSVGFSTALQKAKFGKK